MEPTLSEVKQQPYALITTYGTNISQMEADARLQFSGLFNIPSEDIGISQTGPATVSEETMTGHGATVARRWQCDWHGWVTR